MSLDIPAGWRPLLQDQLEQPYWAALEQFVAAERAQHTVFPPAGKVFTALETTPYEQANVLLLGQDPYHDDGQAQVLDGVRVRLPDRGQEAPHEQAEVLVELALRLRPAESRVAYQPAT